MMVVSESKSWVQGDEEGAKSFEEDQQVHDDGTSLSARCSRAVKYVHRPVVYALVKAAVASAKRPLPTLLIGATLATALLGTGFFTNFRMELDEKVLWTPQDSLSQQHVAWLQDESDFEPQRRRMMFGVHAQGDNILSMQGIHRVFDAMEGVDGAMNQRDRRRFCSPDCWVESITRFWNFSRSTFEDEIQTDEDILEAISQSSYPDGGKVDLESILGSMVVNETSGKPTRGDIFLNRIWYEGEGEARLEYVKSVEAKVIQSLSSTRDRWEEESSNPFRLDFLTERSMGDEFRRSIVKDIPLVVAIFFVMSTFTAILFYKRDPVQSRMMVGVGAVVTIVMSIATGYGIAMLFGIPLTSMTQLLPFIMFGIGLDDAFIITGSFYRLDPSIPIHTRVEETMKDVGASIALTTATSAVAFGLGCLSTIPAVYWLCLYAFPTIIIDFFFQVTVFVAMIALDEKRVAARRRDIFICSTVPLPEKEDDNQVHGASSYLEKAEHSMDSLDKLVADIELRESQKSFNELGSHHTESQVVRVDHTGTLIEAMRRKSAMSLASEIDPNTSTSLHPCCAGQTPSKTNMASSKVQPIAEERPTRKSSVLGNGPGQTAEEGYELDLEETERDLGFMARNGGTMEQPIIEEESTALKENDSNTENMSMADRFMVWYSNILVKPCVRFFVIFSALSLAGVFAYSSSLLEQEFDFQDVLPTDSYASAFVHTINEYAAGNLFYIQATFRFVDQSTESVQNQMFDAMSEIEALEQVQGSPAFFWLQDFSEFVAQNETLGSMSFHDQLTIFREDPLYTQLCDRDLAIDQAGNLTASRVWFLMANVDVNDVKEQIEAIQDVRFLEKNQAINQGFADPEDRPFFTYGHEYSLWEFFSVAVDQLIFATVVGVASVTVLSLLIIPHWPAALFVLPTMIVLYVDLLGFIQFCGVKINAVSYVSCSMSIGLLVDFVIHILFRYFELHGDRVTRTKEMLRTMGSSVLIGGLTTLIGVIPIAFASSPIFFTVFATFLGVVVLGLSHGLIVLPVLLATFGPQDSPLDGDDTSKGDSDDTSDSSESFGNNKQES